MSRSRPRCEHRGVDVGEHHQAALAHLARHAGRQIAAAAGDIQRPLPGAQVGEREREAFPQPVGACRHQVVHQVVVAGHGVENPAHAAALSPAARAGSRSPRSRSSAMSRAVRDGVVRRILREARAPACPWRRDRGCISLRRDAQNRPRLGGLVSDSGRAAMSGPFHLCGSYSARLRAPHVGRACAALQVLRPLRRLLRPELVQVLPGVKTRCRGRRRTRA